MKYIGETVICIDGIRFRVGVVARLDRALLSGEIHDRIVFQALEQTLSPGGLLIDIGANCGYFTLLACKNYGARAWAFEPSPRELRRLYDNLALNNCSNVTVFPVALGAEYKMIGLNIAGDDNPGMNSLVDLRAIRPYIAQQSVQVGRLEDFVGMRELGDVQLVKIDVEGYEFQVLKGLANCMSQMRNATFVVEITPSYLARAGAGETDIYEFFRKRGYRPRFGPKSDAQWDEIFVPETVSSRCNDGQIVQV